MRTYTLEIMITEMHVHPSGISTPKRNNQSSRYPINANPNDAPAISHPFRDSAAATRKHTPELPSSRTAVALRDYHEYYAKVWIW